MQTTTSLIQQLQSDDAFERKQAALASSRCEVPDDALVSALLAARQIETNSHVAQAVLEALDQPAIAAIAAGMAPTAEPVAESTKPCPFCAETVKVEAIVCRYCGRDLPTAETAAAQSAAELAAAHKLLSDTATKVGLVLIVIAVIVIWYFGF